MVPSGFTHVVDVSSRRDSTSTREPCAFAVTRADTRSGREVTVFAAAGFFAAGVVAEAGSAATNVTVRAATTAIADACSEGRKRPRVNQPDMKLDDCDSTMTKTPRSPEPSAIESNRQNCGPS